MKPMRYFLDTHDRQLGTFPEQLTPEQFAAFFTQYEQACQAEGVVALRTHLSYEAGRAFCLNLAPDAEAVKRAHARVGLPFDSIVEVTTATPGDTFFRRQAA
ncbi:MAG TPA: DUF4242 domain-containing protein [Azonexus sp.]|nr:DUF4242 domain-containing protein [Azonexus sp.]